MIKMRNLIQAIILLFLSLFVLFIMPGWHDMKNEMRVSVPIILAISLAVIGAYFWQKRNDHKTKN